MNILGWITDRLTPGHFKTQASQAEAELAEARRLEQRADRLVAAYRHDRLRNHYAERVRAAYAGRKTP